MQNLTQKMNQTTIRIFHFNPIMVNTMVLHDETGEAIIVDPGNIASHEDCALQQYIDEHHLTVKFIVNTHPHIDHIAGNAWCVKTYQAPLLCHEAGMPVYNKAFAYGAAFGMEVESMPTPDRYVLEGDGIRFGNQCLQVLYTPGHCDGSISLYHPTDKFVIVGDLIFEGSVGRSDLPTGSGRLLIQSIEDKILTLGDSVTIYPGHGGSTSVGFERNNNPFIQ